MKPATLFCQAINLVESEPKLPIQISKATFVVLPAAIEINRAVQSLLEHCPPPTGSSIGRTELTSFLGGNLIKVGGNKLTSPTS